MGTPAADRRLAVLQAQLQALELEAAADGLSCHPTSAQGEAKQYSVALPEVLTPDGPWLVRR